MAKAIRYLSEAQCWLLAAPDGNYFHGLRWEWGKAEGDKTQLPPSPMVVFATEKAAIEGQAFFGLLDAVPCRADKEDMDDYLRQSWMNGARSVYLAERFGPDGTTGRVYRFHPPKRSSDGDDGGPPHRLRKRSESEPLQSSWGTGKTKFLDPSGQQEFRPIVASLPFASVGEHEYRQAVKKAMKVEVQRRGGTFNSTPEYRTADDFLDAVLKTYELVVTIGRAGRVSPADTAKMIIESVTGRK
jgi:hypothetical protein